MTEGSAMLPQKPYVRRVSSTEAREGYVLVLKSRLSFLPPIGEPFEIVCGSRTHKGKVEAVACACRGPDKPHEHYFIRWGGLHARDRITIGRDPREHSRYCLKVTS